MDRLQTLPSLLLKCSRIKAVRSHKCFKSGLSWKPYQNIFKHNQFSYYASLFNRNNKKPFYWSLYVMFLAIIAIFEFIYCILHILYHPNTQSSQVSSTVCFQYIYGYQNLLRERNMGIQCKKGTKILLRRSFLPNCMDLAQPRVDVCFMMAFVGIININFFVLYKNYTDI